MSVPGANTMAALSNEIIENLVLGSDLQMLQRLIRGTGLTYMQR